MIRKFVIRLGCLILIASCSFKPTPIQQDFLLHTTKGKLNEQVCRGDDYNRYVLYLPTQYSLEKQFPVLFCFDPHADAMLAANFFKDYAEQNNIIIIASATLQNGLSPEEISMYLYQLYADVKAKIWIDTTHIYAAGFSGGARVAAMFANIVAPVAGLISCSAGFYPVEKCVPSVLIAGTLDMNYLETKFADYHLKDFQCPHCFMTFEGTHQWPPQGVLHKAMDMLLVWRYGSKNFIQTSEGKIKFQHEEQDLLTALNNGSADSLWLTLDKIRVFLATYGDLPETKSIRERYDSLLQLRPISSFLDRKIQAEKYEEEQQTIARQAMGSKSLDWWRKIIADWEKLETEKNAEYRAVYKRLLAYVSLFSFSYTNAAIRQGDWAAAKYVLNIYGMADPQNPDYHYFMACWFVHEHEIQKALKELEMAFQKGFSRTKALNDPLLADLKPYLTAQKP